MVDEFLRVILDLQPDGFVFENVASLLHPTNKIIVEKFVEITEENGYKNKIFKANALDYGVPQKRKRLFIIGTKGKFKTTEPIKTHCNKENCEQLGLKPYVNVGEAIYSMKVINILSHMRLRVGLITMNYKVPRGMNYKALTAWAG